MMADKTLTLLEDALSEVVSSVLEGDPPPTNPVLAIGEALCAALADLPNASS